MRRAQSRKFSVPVILISISATVLIFILILSNSNLSNSSFSGLSPVNPDSIGFLNREDDDVLPLLPRLAYFISGTSGDSVRMKRLLQALYHPRNHYLLHLNFEASELERLELVKYAKSEAVMRGFKNVMVVGKGNLVISKGPTMMASTLHGMAILLKQAEHWDWFINLGASDYPLMPQDGSSNVILTRPFLEFCIWGVDNLPRTLLMYYTNFLSSLEGYFHTVMCNHKDYQNTTINNDLHYSRWDDPLKEQPSNLTVKHFDDMVQSGASFAHQISENDPLLDRIDKELLKRSSEMITPGGWCSGTFGLNKDPCMVYGSSNVVRPSSSSKRLEKLVLKLLDSENFRSKQCK